MGHQHVDSCEATVPACEHSSDPLAAVPVTTPTGSTMTSSADGSPRGTRLNTPSQTYSSASSSCPVVASTVEQTHLRNEHPASGSTASSNSLKAEQFAEPPPNGIAEGFMADSASWMTVSTATVDSVAPDGFFARRVVSPLPSSIADSAVLPRQREKSQAHKKDPHLSRQIPASNRSRTVSQSTSIENSTSPNCPSNVAKKNKAFNSPAPPSSLISFTNPESTRVELRIEAYNLLNTDTLSLSDPFVVLYADHFGVGAEELGRTETVFDDLNPKFQTRFVFTYRTSRSSNVIIELYDRDWLSENASLTRHDFLGRTEVDVASVLDEPGGRVTLELRPAEGKKDARMDRGMVSIFAEVLLDPELGYGVARRPRPKQVYQGSRSPSQFLLSDHDLKISDDVASLHSDYTEKSRASQMQQVLEMRQFLQNSITRPGIVVLRVNCAALKRKKSVSGLISSREVVQFFELQRKRAEARGKTSWTTVYRSEDGRRINSNGYIEFKTAALNESAIHNGQPRRELRFVFYRRNVRSAHDMVCYAQASLAELVTDRRGHSLAAVPLCGQYTDDEGLGAMQVVGCQRDPTRDDTLVLDLSVDIFMPRGYCSSLMESRARQKIVGGGFAGYLQKHISLH